MVYSQLKTEHCYCMPYTPYKCNCSQSNGLALAQVNNILSRILSNRSTSPSFCGWYGVLLDIQYLANLDSNWLPLGLLLEKPPPSNWSNLLPPECRNYPSYSQLVDIPSQQPYEWGIYPAEIFPRVALSCWRVFFVDYLFLHGLNVKFHFANCWVRSVAII